MVFGKKKKKKQEATEEETPTGFIDTSENPEEEKQEEKPMTAEQKANMEEMKEMLGYFTNRYAYVSFEDNFGGLKPMLFAIFCELRKMNEKLEEEEE